MGKMLLWKFSESGINREDLFVSNRTIAKAEEAKDIAQVVSAKELAEVCDITFVCVRPADIKTVLEEIKDDIKEGALVVSLNGSVSFEAISKITDCSTAKVIRSEERWTAVKSSSVSCRSLPFPKDCNDRKTKSPESGRKMKARSLGIVRFDHCPGLPFSAAEASTASPWHRLHQHLPDRSDPSLWLYSPL